jgi:lysophospholipase L1-like esterase
MAESGKRPTKRRRLFHAIALTFSLSVSLVAGEGFLRLKNASMTNYDIEMWNYSRRLKVPSANPLLAHTHRKSTTATLQSVEIRLNEYGLRGGPLTPVGAGKRRILVLGSSITLGWGVKEEDTLTARLEEMFRREAQEVQVLNAGIGNYNTVRYVERFLTDLAALAPTDVVVHFFVNDAEQLPPGGGNILTRNSQLAVTLWSGLQKATLSGGKEGLEAHYRAVYSPDSPGYGSMVKALERLSEHARKEKIRLFLAMTPDIHNLENYPFQFVHEDVRRIAQGLGYRYVDLLPALADLEPGAVWNMPGDPHPNSLGHELMAKSLFPVLAE